MIYRPVLVLLRYGVNKLYMRDLTGNAILGSIEQVGLENVIIFVLLVLITVFSVNVITTVLSRYLKKFVGPPYYKVLPKIITYPLYFASLYYGFNYILGFNVQAFLVGFGILGIAIALSAQQTLQNLIAGIILTIERPFSIGDIVDYAGNVCRVKDIFLRTTVLRTMDGKIIYAPNSSFVTGNVINYSKGEYIRVTSQMYYPPNADYKKIEEIIKKECHEHPDVLPHLHRKKTSFFDRLLDEPIDVTHFEPRIFIKSIDKDKILLETWFWIEDVRRKEEILSSILEKVIKRFNEEGIKYG